MLSAILVYLIWVPTRIVPRDSGEEFVLLISQVLYGLALVLLAVGTVGLWLRYRASAWVAGVALGGLCVFTGIMVLAHAKAEVIGPIMDRPERLLEWRSLLLLGVTLAGPKVPLWALLWAMSAMFHLKRRYRAGEAGGADAGRSAPLPPARSG